MNDSMNSGTAMTKDSGLPEQSTRRTQLSRQVRSARPVPKGRSGQPVRAASPLRRVLFDCHGWVRDAGALTGDWVWCDSCGDFARVTAVED